MSQNIVEVTNENFEEEVLKSEKPVVIDFWAPWCGPCKMLMPTVEAMASKREDVKVVKVNIDENSDLTSRYGIRGIPTLMVLVDGEVEGSKTGAMTPAQLDGFLETCV